MAEDTKIHDVIMIGAGPAALAAALYTSREDIEKLMPVLATIRTATSTATTTRK